MAAPSLASRVDRELRQAGRFRAEGRAGRSRVCARRAAGWAIGPTFRRLTGTEPPASALSLLQWYAAHPATPDRLRRAAQRLTVHVTEDHALPHPDDPLEDARALIEGLRAGEP
jgi:hypothetical protein